MKLVITGAFGLLGKVATAYAQQQGADVLAVDRIPAPPGSTVGTLRVDLNDLGQVYDALAGADAVIHLGAIPTQRMFPSATTFVNNVQSTWNVLEAAARLHLPRVVMASSLQVNTTVYPRTPLRFTYLPLDEDHPVSPQDDYGMSKWVGEHLGQMFAEHWGLTTVSFRFPYIATSEAMAHFPTAEEPQSGAALYAYLHIDDAARACYLAATAPLPPRSHTVLFAAAPDTYLAMPSAAYIRHSFPEASVRGELGEYGALISSQRAEDMIGFKAAISFRERRNG